MRCSYHKITTHNDADCRVRPANGLNGNAIFVQVRPSSVPGIFRLWYLLVHDDSNEKPCISFLAREVQPAAKPAKARVEEEKEARSFGRVRTAATEGWRTRPWPFIPRAEPQPATKPIKVRVEEEKGARPFGPVSIALTEGWRTRPWPFTSRAEQAISFGGPVAKEKSNLGYTFGMANDEEPGEKAVMASSSVAVTSEDSVKSNLATLMAPAEPLPGEVRKPLTGGASTLRGGRASPKTAQPSPAPVPATARTEAAIRNHRIHRPNVVTRRADAELTGAVTRFSGVRPNKNNNDDDDNINNNNHAALAERFQSSTLYKLRQLGLYINTNTPDDNNINNNNYAALVARFQPSSLHKLRQLGLHTNTITPDYNNINNNNHASLAECVQPGTLHKLRQLGRYTNTGTPDTTHQLDAEAVPVEVAYTKTNTQPSCSGGGRIGPCPEHIQGGHGRSAPSYVVTLHTWPIGYV